MMRCGETETLRDERCVMVNLDPDTAEKDPEGLQDQVKRLADALREAGTTVRFITVKGRDHFSIVRRFGPGDDATAEAAAEFINVLGRGEQE